MPIRSSAANRSEPRAAPSSIEYSECTCRWTKESLPADEVPAAATELPDMNSIYLQLAALPACCTRPDRSSRHGRCCDRQAPTVVARPEDPGHAARPVGPVRAAIGRGGGDRRSDAEPSLSRPADFSARPSRTGGFLVGPAAVRPPRVAVLQHTAVCPPGRVGRWLEEEGCTLEVFSCFAGDPLPVSLQGYAALVVLGGEMGAYDD